MKVVTIGEIMMRLSPEGFKRFNQAKKFDLCFGGGEANVAVSLAQFGVDAAFCTKLPENPLADACIGELRGFGVDTRYIARGGSRMGIYFAEKGASQRPSKVIYDRANSAITTIAPKDVDIAALLDGADWLHFTGITPALGEKPREFTSIVLAEAKKQGITVSCDLNYRNKLWSRDTAREVMTSLMQFVDVLIANEEDVYDVFGYRAGGSVTDGKLSADDYAELGRRLIKEFDFSKVAFTLRESISASENGWSGVLISKDGVYTAEKYNLKLIDRIGGGDSFAAGLIYALLRGDDGLSAVNFAVAASALKQSIEGDYNLVTVDEVEKLKGGDKSGRVQR